MLKEWNITIPELTGDEERKAYVYVPDSAFADASRRYPVLYMFDGHNLFADAKASSGKSLGLLDYLTKNNVQLIIAALDCNRHQETDPCGGRLSEYSPFDFYEAHVGAIRGRGELTMQYLVNEFKPWIDEHYPTLPDREHTFVSGSSMGGLMTIWALLTHGDTFSRGAALSPYFLFTPNEIKEAIRTATFRPTVLYMDMGQEELRTAGERELYGQISAMLVEKEVLVTSRVVPGGLHSELSWEKQLPIMFSVLLYELD
jgi:predicted alpha/beta superfamily hydrolase